MKLTQKDLAYFTSVIGERFVLTSREAMEPYGHDWTKGFSPAPGCVLLPQNVEEIAALMKHCNVRRLPVVPNGGRTGLAGGAVALHHEVVISLERLNQIHAIDPVGLTVDVGAGVTTQALQEAVDKEGFFFAIDLSSKGSCQVGGNVATNAGGLKFVRYGGTRDQVLGLEVVLADGAILNLNRALRKNNTGYDLAQLFIGSEGTLGIITRITFKIEPKPINLTVALFAVEGIGQVLALFECCARIGIGPTSFEFFSHFAMERVLAQFKALRSPLGTVGAYYVLIEVDGKDSGSRITDLMEVLSERGLILDAVLSTTSQEYQAIWGLRENISESLNLTGRVRRNDVSLPLNAIAKFVQQVETLVQSLPHGIRAAVFGHVGDGNLHLTYVSPSLEAVDFARIAEDLEREVYRLVASFSGSISAEHGIGLLKKAELGYSRTDMEVTFMKQIKAVFDANSILNPGKIFDL